MRCQSDTYWINGDSAIAHYFPGATSAWSALALHPAKYCEYLYLSLLTSAIDVRVTFGQPFLWVFGLAAVVGTVMRTRLDPLVQRFAYALVGLIPVVLLSFLHVRYLARFLPLSMIACLSVVEGIWFEPRIHRVVRWIVLGALVGATASYTKEALEIIADARTLPAGTPFWGAD